MNNEKNYFIGLFHFKGFDEVVPMLIKDFRTSATPRLTREFIGETLRVIRSRQYMDEYLEIISNPVYGLARAPIFSLIGSIKADEAIPTLVNLLESDDKESVVCALQALSDYKREEFRPHFERFKDDENSQLQKVAISALKKLKK